MSGSSVQSINFPFRRASIAPKYRRKVFYGKKKIVIGQILRQLCEWKGVNIIEAEVCPDHVHMLV
ncbi:MAG: transposase, partial [Firmicutes bacterium]|nr:transposase [Bacillota bacterium]